jgi:short-subunit dehydrogenase
MPDGAPCVRPASFAPGKVYHRTVRQLLSPGVTETEFLEVAGQRRSLYQRLSMMRSRPVAQIGIDAMLRGKPSKVAGAMNAVTAWSLRFVPRRLQAAMASAAMQLGA